MTNREYLIKLLEEANEKVFDFLTCEACAYRNKQCGASKQDCYRGHKKWLAAERVEKQGKWERSDIPGEEWVCSYCGGAAWYYDYRGVVARSMYCPNCGAFMGVDV